MFKFNKYNSATKYSKDLTENILLSIWSWLTYAKVWFTLCKKTNWHNMKPDILSTVLPLALSKPYLEFGNVK